MPDKEGTDVYAISRLARIWAEARKAFLALPPGHPDTRARLTELADAEDKLYRQLHHL